MMSVDFVHAFARALVIGGFGGVALVLTQVYSRRGPLIYPVYAAILCMLSLSLARATALPFLPRLVIAFAAILVSTAFSVAATVVLARRARRRHLAAGASLAPGRIPSWALPLLLLTLVTVSAGAAFVSM